MNAVRQSSKSNLRALFSSFPSSAPIPVAAVVQSKGKGRRKQKEKKEISQPQPVAKPYTKKKITGALREAVWIKTMGKVFEGKCPVVWCPNTITVFDFQSGHNIPESKGGSTTLPNLIPICARCNFSMGNHYTIDEWNILHSSTSTEVPKIQQQEEIPRPSFMGITVGPLVTPQGFQVNSLYIRIVTFRILLTQGNSTYHCIFSYEGFKSYEDKVHGYSPLSIPEELRQAETIINVLEFLRKDIFEIGYSALKSRLAGSSYTVNDIHEPSQYKGSDYRFNRSGYDIDGYNSYGFNVSGYDKDGLNAQGYDSEGYDRDGYNAQGYNRQGLDRNGYDVDGYNCFGYNQAGVDRDGNIRPTMSMP